MKVQRNFYLNKLIESKNDGLVKIITGIRRCGKSYLVNVLFYEHLLNSGIKEDHIIKITLDDDKNEELLDNKKLGEYIRNNVKDNDNYNYYILLDEIQLVNNFESTLNGLLRIENVDIYVTGSNSKFLSTDIITEFRGRGEEIRIYPLSFSEFLSVYEGEIIDAWNEYSTYGGLPVIITSMNTEERKMNYLKEQTNNVYINDVIERNNIHNDNEIINILIEIISSGIGSLTNAKKISDTFKSNNRIDIAPATISKYLSYLEEAFIIERTKRFDVKGRKYIITPSKYYFCDIGIRNSLINYRQQEETHIMENIIYLELKRRGFNVDVGLVEYKGKEKGKDFYKQLEIDFIANKGNNKYYIQSAFSIPDNEKRNQEERPLLKINDSFKKIIITRDYIKTWRDENGIITMSIFEFLKNENSLNY